MQVTINGEKKEIPDRPTVRELLAFLEIEPETVVVERNREIFSTADFEAVRLQADDVIEILKFMGGG
ncbi:sulfur carrier protein ThiS [candidate division FCPU426 bacterium]|nr:sulfur carrier protein ThiS [candidate division FCPU426 bacterium]